MAGQDSRDKDHVMSETTNQHFDQKPVVNRKALSLKTQATLPIPQHGYVRWYNQIAISKNVEAAPSLEDY
ncbi:hypothetical protein NC651_003339 [Populus alba x Populus x berolinensis]|nr:hypothetical protein NC651_003339 [Populus alba x Populus x berolinensis]